ncbi:MAG: segregation/condensation protein A [Clostridia bacterium]|nr:segregation/condensation protein A [Clostridia bacterium]
MAEEKDILKNQQAVDATDTGNQIVLENDREIKYKLPDFEGPIALLLHLIKEKKKDVMEISISEITDQYFAYIDTLKENDMEIATEFLVIAAKLMAIKSFKMLPVEEMPEDDDFVDPEMELKLQIAEYEIFKEASENLHNIENVNRFYKAPDKSVGDSRIVFNQFNLDKMLDAFARILLRVEDKENPAPEKKINRDRWTVAEKLSFLKGVLKENKEISFYSLFDDNYSKLEVITVFLAVLELLKFQYAEVIQDEVGQDMIIRAKEIPDVEMNEAVSFDEPVKDN